MLDNAKNFVKVIVSQGYDQNAYSIVLSSGQGAKLATAPFNLTWWNSTDYSDPSDDPNVEIVRVTAVNGDTLTLINNGSSRTPQESTSATAKNLSGKTYLMLAGATAKLINADIPGLFIFGEVVSGSGTSYTLANTPITANGKPILLLVAARNVLYPGIDFSISGAAITLINGNVFRTGDLLAFYLH